VTATLDSLKIVGGAAGGARVQAPRALPLPVQGRRLALLVRLRERHAALERVVRDLKEGS